jgi:hypothetical protein
MLSEFECVDVAVAGEKLLSDLTLEFYAVGTVIRHGLSSFESPAWRVNS